MGICDLGGLLQLLKLCLCREFFFLIILFILFLALLGLCCCTDFSLVVASRRYSPAAGCRLLIAVASSVAEHRL